MRARDELETIQDDIALWADTSFKSLMRLADEVAAGLFFPITSELSRQVERAENGHDHASETVWNDRQIGVAL